MNQDAAKRTMRDAIANVVQLITVNPVGSSFQADADDWAASSIEISAFVDTLTTHASAVMADAITQTVTGVRADYERELEALERARDSAVAEKIKAIEDNALRLLMQPCAECAQLRSQLVEARRANTK